MVVASSSDRCRKGKTSCSFGATSAVRLAATPDPLAGEGDGEKVLEEELALRAVAAEIRNTEPVRRGVGAAPVPAGLGAVLRRRLSRCRLE